MSNQEIPTNVTPRNWGVRSLRQLTVLALAILLIVVAIAGIEIGRITTSAAATLSVMGSGTVQGAPDAASFDIGVHTSNSSAKSAENANTQKVVALISALKSSGVTSKEMQTSGFNIYQNTNNAGVVTGFSVDNTLHVTMHHIAEVGAAIDAATSAVGNGIQVNGITFSNTNQSTLLSSARAKAMHNARLAANQLANAGGTAVTGIVRVSDQENPIAPIFYGQFTTPSAKGMTATVPVQGGRQTITVQVSVVYSLK